MPTQKQILLTKKFFLAHKLAASVAVCVFGVGGIGISIHFATSGPDPLVPVKVPGITNEKSIFEPSANQKTDGDAQPNTNNPEGSSNTSNKTSGQSGVTTSNQNASSGQVSTGATDSGNDGNGTSGGSSGGGGSSTPTNNPPTAPTNAVATIVQYNRVTIRVNRATDSDGSIVRHELLRNGSVVGTSTSTSSLVTISDTSVVSGQNYTFAVRAVDNLGALGPNSNSVSVTVPIQDTTPPSVPTNFRLTSNTPGNVTLAWDPSTDDQSSQQDIWYIITSPLNESYFYTWTRINPYSTGWFDQPGTTHDVYIQAIDLLGNTSAKAGPVTFTAQ